MADLVKSPVSLLRILVSKAAMSPRDGGKRYIHLLNGHHQRVYIGEAVVWREFDMSGD